MTGSTRGIVLVVWLSVVFWNLLTSLIITSIVTTMSQPSYRRSPLALAVLGTLYEEPMHPYRIQQLIKERGKDQVINVQQRASIYQTIERLHHAGLIEIVERTRDERWPERTVYQLTGEGRAVAGQW